MMQSGAPIRSMLSSHHCIMRCVGWKAARSLSSAAIAPAKRIKDLVRGGNVFADFTALSIKHGAANLGQGFPSFGSPQFLSDSLSEVCHGDIYSESTSTTPLNLNYQYTKPGEEPALAQLLADRYSFSFGKRLFPSNICTTVGAQEALFTTFASFCNEGDEMVTITPAFDSYFRSAAVLGIDVKGVPLRPRAASQQEAADFVLDIEALRSTLSKKTKILLLNTPSSPLGKVFTREELLDIAAVVKDFPNLIVVSDEVYECMTFGGLEHVHFASLPEMFNRTISIFSAGKTFSCTGWRVGYAVGPQDLIHSVKTLHSVINFSTTTTFQKVVAKAFSSADKNDYFNWLPVMLQKKRDRLCAAMDSVGMDYILPQGGYFVVADVSKFFRKAGIDISTFDDLNAVTPLLERPDVQFSKWLVTEIGVGPIPMSPFYLPHERHLANNYIRLAYCKDDLTLDTAIERLKRKLHP